MREMTLFQTLESKFDVSKIDDEAILLRRRGDGRSMVLVLNDETRRHISHIVEEQILLAEISEAIGRARGKERYLIASGGTLVPSMDRSILLTDDSSVEDPPNGGNWEPYEH